MRKDVYMRLKYGGPASIAKHGTLDRIYCDHRHGGAGEQFTHHRP